MYKTTINNDKKATTKAIQSYTKAKTSYKKSCFLIGLEGYTLFADEHLVPPYTASKGI